MSAADTTALLQSLRAGGPSGDAARAALSAEPRSDGTDPRAALRAEVVVALLSSLAPSDHEIAAWLLQQEVSAHRAAGQGASDALLGLVAAVARFGQPEDALLIWQASVATPEARSAVDVEQLGRLGVERVRALWQRQARQTGPNAGDARAALAWLEAGAAAGAFSDLGAYFAWSDEINGLTTGVPV